MEHRPYTIATAYLDAIDQCRSQILQAREYGQVEVLKVLVEHYTKLLNMLASCACVDGELRPQP